MVSPTFEQEETPSQASKSADSKVWMQSDTKCNPRWSLVEKFRNWQSENRVNDIWSHRNDSSYVLSCFAQVSRLRNKGWLLRTLRGTIAIMVLGTGNVFANKGFMVNIMGWKLVEPTSVEVPMFYVKKHGTHINQVHKSSNVSFREKNSGRPESRHRGLANIVWMYHHAKNTSFSQCVNPRHTFKTIISRSWTLEHGCWGAHKVQSTYN